MSSKYYSLASVYISASSEWKEQSFLSSYIIRLKKTFPQNSKSEKAKLAKKIKQSAIVDNHFRLGFR